MTLDPVGEPAESCLFTQQPIGQNSIRRTRSVISTPKLVRGKVPVFISHLVLAYNSQTLGSRAPCRYSQQQPPEIATETL